MKVYTSYFYQIRFFKPYMIPLSTAVWDPKWYHNFKEDNTVSFIDNNGVINGLRIHPLAPSSEGCASECRGRKDCKTLNPESCAFRRHYAEQLDAIDFTSFMNTLGLYCEKVQNLLCFDEEPIAVLIVYETPNNPCSERVELHRWFKRNGVILEELPYPIVENFM